MCDGMLEHYLDRAIITTVLNILIKILIKCEISDVLHMGGFA